MEASNKNKLGDMIEKIVESGSLSADDQKKINIMATSLDLDNRDIQAMRRLTAMIAEGRITVN